MEKKKINKSIVYMVSGIAILILAIAGSAYAYYAATATGEIVGSAAGAGLELTIEKLSTSASGALIPLDNTPDMLTKAAKGYGNTGSSFDASKSCIDKNGYTVCQVYKITISNTSTVPVVLNGGVSLTGVNTPNIECAKMDSSTSVTNNASCKGDTTLAKNYTLNAGSSKDYYVIVYIKNIDEEQEDVGVFNGTITFTSTQGHKLYAKFKDMTASETIQDLFIPNTTAVNNSITYQYDTVNNLMEDTAGNIRYYGASPNNYIYFNCETYPETNCELWRIIGVVDGKLKLIRNESIGDYPWDTSASTVNSGVGINEWSQADLMKLLNPGYESNTDLNKSGTSITVNNSLYYNSGSGTCYSGIKNSTKSCDFTSIGIKNDTTRNMISDSTYYLGGGSSAEIYSNTALTMERGTNVVIPGTTCSGTNCNDTVTRTTSWTGKIGLMYPSDYGYATDFTKCSQNLYNYNNSTDSYACRTNDWLHNNITQWLLTPRSSYARDVWYVYSSGGVFDGNSVFLAFGVRPVLYLNSVLVIESGSGTESDPYRISA